MNTDPARGTGGPGVESSGAEVRGLPRLVLETHARLGPKATPEQVVDELRCGGVEATVEEVRSLWPEGGNQTG
jgi:hypothetical protein